MKKLYSLLTFLILAMMVLTACGQPTSSNVDNRFASLTRADIVEFKELYTTTFEQETTVAAAFDEWKAFDDNLFLKLKDMTWLAQNCYGNVEEVLRNATIGLFDTSHDADGAPNGILDKEAMLSALVTNNLYPANADKCSEIMNKTADEVVKGRTQSYEKQFVFIEQMRTLRNVYDNELGKAAFKRFLDVYGQEFIAWANGKLGEYGISEFPTDFVGFPTSGLSAKTTSRDWYEHYALIYAGVKPPSDPRFAKEMFLVTWNGPENIGYAMLYRQAAYEFMNQMFLSTASQNSINCGGAAPSLSETYNAECTPVPNSPYVPTEAVPATPKP